MHKSSLSKVGTKEQEILNQKMIIYAQRIENLGGAVVSSEKDMLGVSNPIISDTEHKILAYNIGSVECERINESLIEDINGFIKNY